MNEIAKAEKLINKFHAESNGVRGERAAVIRGMVTDCRNWMRKGEPAKVIKCLSPANVARRVAQGY